MVFEQQCCNIHMFFFLVSFYRNHLFRLNLEDLTLIQVSVNSLLLCLFDSTSVWLTHFWVNICSLCLLIRLLQSHWHWHPELPASNKHRASVTACCQLPQLKVVTVKWFNISHVTTTSHPMEWQEVWSTVLWVDTQREEKVSKSNLKLYMTYTVLFHIF